MAKSSEALLELTVANTRLLTQDIRAIRLVAASGEPLPPFSAGAHITLQVAPDHAASMDTRAYSLINSTDQAGHYEIAVKLEEKGRGGSRFMHALTPGQRIKASLPTNDFPLFDQDHHAVLIAGGIGITPIFSMAQALVSRGRSYELHYATRSPDLMAFHDEVTQCCGPNSHLYFDYGDPTQGMPLDNLINAPENDRHLYVCGPRPLIDAVINTARQRQWPDSHIHFELFGAAPQAGDRPCRVVLQRSGITLDVPAETTILNAMIQAGVDPMFDCQRGECGVCAVRVIAGDPDHRDYALSDEDHQQDHLMCVCISRSKSAELVLDA